MARGFAVHAWEQSTCPSIISFAIHSAARFGLPHAETHAIILPHVIAYNHTECCDEMAVLADVSAGSKGDALRGILFLQQELGIAMSLKDCGLNENAIQTVAQIAIRNPYHHVKPFGEAELVRIVTAAWAGERPHKAP